MKAFSRWALIPFVIILCTLLPACVQPTTSTQGNSSHTSSVPDETVASGTPLRQANSSSADGYYSIGTPFSSPLITYIDYKTSQRIILCARPECGHNDPSCTAFCMDSSSYTPSLFVVGDYLYRLQSVASEISAPNIMRSALDGSNPEEFCQFPSNWDLGLIAYTDDESLFFLVNYADKESAQLHWSVISVNLDTGTYEYLYQFELNQSVGYVFTTFDRNLVIKLYPQNLPGGAPAECRLFNVDTCQLSDPIVQVDNEEVGIFAEGNTLFLVDYENEQLRLCNMANSEWTSISYAPLCDSINSPVNKPFVFYVFDEWLRFEFWDSENYATQACFLFNMESQEFIPFDLRMSYNENWITILQIRGDNLLVQSGWLVEQDGETVTNVNAQFAFISKNDFLNSRPVYQLISSQW